MHSRASYGGAVLVFSSWKMKTRRIGYLWCLYDVYQSATFLLFSTSFLCSLPPPPHHALLTGSRAQCRIAGAQPWALFICSGRQPTQTGVSPFATALKDLVLLEYYFLLHKAPIRLESKVMAGRVCCHL